MQTREGINQKFDEELSRYYLGTLAGVFVTVRADSVDEAVGFAKGCPVLQGDGNSVEVQQIV
jgi:hypothetical protein